MNLLKQTHLIEEIQGIFEIEASILWQVSGGPLDGQAAEYSNKPTSSICEKWS
jgi:hypothetical protein